MDQKDLFTPRTIPPLPEHRDEVVTSIVTIDALPGGLGQISQRLPEPIESMHFKTIKIKEGECDSGRFTPIMVPVKMISAEQGLEMIKTGQFNAAMVPKKLQCRDCDRELEPDRGLLCKECRPHLGEDPGDMRYCGVSGE
jgi:hypothetical protein